MWLNATKKAKKKESGQTVNGRNSGGDQRDSKDTCHQLNQYEEEQLAKSRYIHVLYMYICGIVCVHVCVCVRVCVCVCVCGDCFDCNNKCKCNL